jgi:very-short-patch-repair endonuclease
MTPRQRLWAALLWAGQGAALAGLTAAGLDGLAGFAGRDGTDHPIHLLVPSCRSVRRKPPELSVVVHYSVTLTSGDVHPLREPRRTRMARSLVEAAAWMTTDRGAQAVLAAGVQQRLVRIADLTAIVARNQRLPRRGMITDTLEDIAGGALDAVWKTARLVVEVDGRHHMDAAQYWADMDRDSDFLVDGYRVLRFPAFLVRYHPGYVAGTIRAALRAGMGMQIPA